MEPDRMNPEWPFSKFGMDSIIALEALKVLESRFGPLPQSLLFEVENLSELGDYLLDNKSDVIGPTVSSEVDAGYSKPVPSEKLFEKVAEKHLAK